MVRWNLDAETTTVKVIDYVELPIKKLYPNAILPTKAHEDDAGFDLYAYIPGGGVEIPPQQNVKIDTGISIAIPPGYFGGIYARSGISTKRGLRPANLVGVIDSQYRGPIIVALYNDNALVSQVVNTGDKIAQLIIQPIPSVVLKEVDELDDTERGQGGFGSTGI